MEWKQGVNLDLDYLSHHILKFGGEYMIEGINKLKLEKENEDTTLIRIEINEGFQKELEESDNEIEIRVSPQEDHEPGNGDDNGDTPEPPSQVLEGITIALDPGHGGSDTGAVSPSGLEEKEISLNVSLELEERLENLGAEVVMTRNEDIYVSLGERVRIANNSNADIFISIHFNAFNDSSANGTETFWHTRGTAQSERLATLIQNQLLDKLGRRNRGVKQENYYVLRETEMTSALTEPLFITNPTEEQIIMDEANQSLVAQAIEEAILEFYS